MCESHGHSHAQDHFHPHGNGHPHDHPTGFDRRTLLKMAGAGLGGILLASCGSGTKTSTIITNSTSSILGGTTTTGNVVASSSTIADSGTLAGFDAFADTVKAFTQGDMWMVESNGMPAHNMMVGITSWQQQFPVPQPYNGTNAWQFPVTPVLAATPISAKTSLYRGAIALAVNGVPIFNALNNRGDDAFLVGELDQWGGHCGRADDYHYHIAPLHLQELVGLAPIAYALDGYPIYGSTEPDGSALRVLDEYNGHSDEQSGYHYHGTATYPYINGGLVGVVRVANEQIEPQPTTKPFREAGEPLRGAVITTFNSPKTNSYVLEYTVGDALNTVAYEVGASSVAFTFTDSTGATREETYTR